MQSIDYVDFLPRHLGIDLILDRNLAEFELAVSLSNRWTAFGMRLMNRSIQKLLEQLKLMDNYAQHYWEWGVSQVNVPCSLDITPPSFISPPFRFARIRCEGIFISNLLIASPDNGRTLRLQRMRGRLELTVPPYIECSYLLTSDTPTKRLATRRQARS